MKSTAHKINEDCFTDDNQSNKKKTLFLRLLLLETYYK